jgi:LAO/AO transport system kinase
VLVPESGDAVQSIKAGIMEIADIFVINKADLGGADKTRRLIQDAMALGPAPPWPPPILLTAAVKDQGGVELWQAIERHWEYLSQSGGLQDRRLQRLKQEVLSLVAEQAREDARRALEGDTPVARRLRQNPNGKLNPYALAAELMGKAS